MSNSDLMFPDEKLGQEKSYWLGQLEGDLVVTGIPADFKRRGALSDERTILRLDIEDQISRKLLKVSEGNEMLAFTFLLTGVKICLHKYSGEEDIIVGTAIHERYAEVASLNKMVALRDRVSRAARVRELLADVKRTLAAAYANQKYPLRRLMKLLNLEQAGNRSMLFDVVVLLRSINNEDNARGLGNGVTLIFSITEEGATCEVKYNPELYKPETIEVFGLHLNRVLGAILEQPDIELGALDMLAGAKKDEVIYGINDTEKEYPRNKAIHELFEEQVERTPEKTAVQDEQGRLSYRELNRRANQLANYLRGQGVSPGVLAAIFLRHSVDAIVAILGVLKAGGAYVPLDPSHPKSRVAFLLSDANPRVVLTERSLEGKLPGSTTNRVVVDSESEQIGGESDQKPKTEIKAEDLAYVIYTSGSTGEPKGVKIQHSALVNYIWWAKDSYVLGEELMFPMYSSLAFDLTVTSIYTPLITGNTIKVYGGGRSEEALEKILSDGQAGVLKLTPSHLALIKERDNTRSHIKRLIVGGEALETDLARKVMESFGQRVELFNEYGPTEATVGCMIYRYDRERDLGGTVPVGRPIANTQIYVLDEALSPVAEMVMGEVYIAGEGLAEGYFNREELTREKFIDNPFIAGRKMYRSGDLARRSPTGELVYAGRKDEQVKFHGYRVELNEIRSALNSHPLIRDSIVVVSKDKQGFDVMIGYYVSRQELASEELRAWLAERVVEETIPNLFVHLKKLPLTLNGKVNLRVLTTLVD
jgi:amino acid adenylation domain-containing protein